MRLFVALVPPDEVLDDLAERVEPRRLADEQGGSDLRWTDRHQWHITLAFLADVPDWRLEDLTGAVAETAARHHAPLLRVAGAGAFPNAYSARVLFADVEQVRGDLRRLASSIRTACNGAGVTPDGTRFHPHVTLGRFRRPTEATRWIRAFEVLEGPVWQASEVAVVESHLGQGRGRRPRYDVVATAPLRSDPPDSFGSR
ncbi:RNA 2',3'-cyclic phosphodiesterase [Intrasporangium calvum]|uniref:RNA 2',3'-cyclic phosphodiesterase n=1 Tax=Intrasporangium calvum TaxID=53358 RepID=A0ABT5GJF2_9MICO|nr:RNA 2',3'-cyclic phosphodiesterase [Intrasporangium calvum]MDC5698332.1 RNA 2',3'-cyclic phosphodiesterase [Intrasporangium calvum]